MSNQSSGLLSRSLIPLILVLEIKKSSSLTIFHPFISTITKWDFA
jgi:hypothetical protein